MLKPEEIAKRLKEARKPAEWVESSLKRLSKLDASIRASGQKAIGYDEKGEHSTEIGDFRLRSRAVAEFERLDEPTLVQLAETLFPKIADAFKGAIALQDRLPYQIGYARKPYRAPGRKDLVATQKRNLVANLVSALHGFDEDLPWIAAHAAHLEQAWWSSGSSIGMLLAAAMDLGGARGEQVDAILRESAAGTHEVGEMGRHVTTAFLCAKDPDGWRFIENMLLAAQRQEGFRQAILESIDFALPDAFRHMLKVILDHNLVRFSSTIRAADVWLALRFDSQSAKYIGDALETLSRLLNDESAQEQALQSDDAERAFLALWCLAFEDAYASIAPATKFLGHVKPEMRIIALHHLFLLGLPETFAHVATAVDDEDLRVATYATEIAVHLLGSRVREVKIKPAEAGTNTEGENLYSHFLYSNKLRRPAADSGDLFERLQRLFERLPAKSKATEPLVWPWMKFNADRRTAADALVLALGERPPSALLPYIETMSPNQREWTALLLGHQEKLDAISRDALLKLVGDASGSVRDRAVQMMKRAKIRTSDLAAIEPLLSRKASDLRRAITNMILSLDDPTALQSVSRLAASKTSPQRLAALELLSRMREAKRSPEKVNEIATNYGASRQSIDREEQAYLDKLLEEDIKTYSLDDALGLMDPSKRTPPTLPVDRGVKLHSSAAIELIKVINALVHEHRAAVVKTRPQYGESSELLLGAMTHFENHFSPYDHQPPQRTPVLRPREDLPLHEVWFAAYERRPKAARDGDGLELARAFILSALSNKYCAWLFKGSAGSMIRGFVAEQPMIQYQGVVHGVICWLVAHSRIERLADFAVDGFETLIAALPADTLTEQSPESYNQQFGFRHVLQQFQALTTELRTAAEEKGDWKPAHTQRMFGLRRWIDEPVVASSQPDAAYAKKTRSGAKSPAPGSVTYVAGIPRDRMDWSELVEAFEAGWANEHDLYDDLLGVRPSWGKSRYYHFGHNFGAIEAATFELHRNGLSSRVEPLVRRAIERVLEIELARGEGETVATPIASRLKYAGGRDVLVRILGAIGRDAKLQRSYSWGAASQGKMPVFSHLIRVTVPGADDTPESFERDVKAEKIGENLLLAVAFYAPQWTRHVQEALQWPMFAESVWWFHAHTKDNLWQVEPQIRETWNAEIRKLTPLTLEDLMEGAVDVDWFHRTHKTLGAKRWERLDEFAKYASGGAGHKRAQLFAQAMLGEVDKKELVAEIDKKRKQDAVRALGLLPLEKKSAKADVLERYKVMQEFVRTSRQFGSLRQASEKLAARIAQENLARTAGYPDPIRLQWAMEGLATADLAAGPVIAVVKDVSVALAIDSEGLPEITVRRGEKVLKSPPPQVKKDEAVAELFERKTDLRRSASRMKGSLEQAMCRGDVFSAEELVELMGNVLLRPMLERLVFIGEGVAGYPTSGGKGLRDHAGKVEPIKKTEQLRLVHPVDLLASKAWTNWQRDCFASERTQPFKQIFRELYVLTSQEKSDATFSRRYAGHQVNPRQAMALLGTRGWITAPEQGVFRTFHDEKLVAWLEFMEPFYTPAEVEGLTLEKVRFATRGATEYAKLTDVPPRVFSEVMRDVDLAASVAHRGAVDPEASAGTVELRASLLRETIQLLKLKNVTINSLHIYIKGTIAEYSVHLGSGTAHMLPGGALFIVPVHSQHRGRIFLPFADDDPKTAEIISKVLLLARDNEIKDPNLLGRIRAVNS